MIGFNPNPKFHLYPFSSKPDEIDEEAIAFFRLRMHCPNFSHYDTHALVEYGLNWVTKERFKRRAGAYIPGPAFKKLLAEREQRRLASLYA